MRIITIDNGNTNPHVGIFQNEKLESIIPIKEFSQQEHDFILISDVGKPLAIKPSFDLKTKRHFKKSHYYFFEMPVDYNENIGDDRLISSYYIFKNIKENETILLIDAGTFITMDLISSRGFLGGYIFPGISTFLLSYHNGSRLRVPEVKNDINNIELPHTTDEAIWGATYCYLDSILENIIKKTSPKKIIITGGSLKLIEKKILELNLPTIQFETNPHLIHSSLFLIFQTHLRSK